MHEIVGMHHRILNALADSHPARAMGVFTACSFAQAIGDLLRRGDHETSFINARPPECIRDAERAKMLGFVEHRVWLDQHESRKQRSNTGLKGCAAKLCERMPPTVRKNDVMPGLRTAVETDDPLGLGLPGEIIDHRPFAAVAESEIDDLNRRSFHSRRLPVVSSNSGASFDLTPIALRMRSITPGTFPRLTICC